MKAMREIVHALRNVLCPSERALYEAVDAAAMLRLGFSPHQIEVECEQCQLLADVVVQLARDARPLRLLRAEQASAEIADPLVAGAELLRAVPRLPFSGQPSALLKKQADDERNLRQQHRGGHDHVLADPMPE